MANRERGEIRLVVAGRIYTLRLTVGACCELEDALEQDFDAITRRVQRGRVTELRALLWASLQGYHASAFPTIDTVTPILDTVSRPALRALLAVLLRLNADDEPQQAQPRTSPAEPVAGSVWRRLYLDARAHGIPGAQFWDLSLRELWREMAAIQQRRRDARDARIVQAWWIANLVWQKKLPDLKSLLTPTEAPRAQTWQEMRATMRAFARAQNAAVASQ